VDKSPILSQNTGKRKETLAAYGLIGKYISIHSGGPPLPGPSICYKYVSMRHDSTPDRRASCLALVLLLVLYLAEGAVICGKKNGTKYGAALHDPLYQIPSVAAFFFTLHKWFAGRAAAAELPFRQAPGGRAGRGFIGRDDVNKSTRNGPIRLVSAADRSRHTHPSARSARGLDGLGGSGYSPCAGVAVLTKRAEFSGIC
jgi:hypothetical protein